ncbi:MAG: CopG family transcriptional regulator [Acidobacteriia bacterium]|nr:CopG family transcriptional regulator [Terriglobia bacterium]
MKVIQVPMDEALLRAVTRTAKARRATRAAFIRKACQEYLHRLEEEELDRKYVEGYRRKPEKPVWGEVGSKMAAEVLAQEDWDETG